MTKHRLMLSAAMAALLVAAALEPEARADTDVTSNTKSALTTSSAGNITIETAGSIELKASAPAVTINSNNFLANLGSISNTDTSSATGVLIDTTAGNIVNSTGVYSVGGINLTGNGNGKAGIAIIGGNTFFGPITLSEVAQTSTIGSTSTTTAIQESSVNVQGDGSYGIFMAQNSTIDGNLALGGIVTLTQAKNSSAVGPTLAEFDGNIQGNLVLDNTSTFQNVGSLARGLVILGPISPCVDNAGLGYTCATTTTAVVGGTTLGNAGSFVNGGAITVVGTALPSTKGNNPEGGSAVVIGNSIAGGFLNNGPATANGNTVTAAITGNGATVGGVAYPALLIDPSQTVTATNAAIRGPIVLGAVPASVDSVDGATATNPGYGFINRGKIQVTPENFDTSSTALIIDGSSPVNNTTIKGGLLNTGSITAAAFTSVNTNSGTSADTVTIGNYVSIPRIVVAGEETSSVTATAGIISAGVSGPGGGSATALGILDQASVPELDVKQHGTIIAQVSTSTIAPTADIASTKTPFIQNTIAVVDASGTLKTINNAGAIEALTTVLTPAPGAVTGASAHAIDLLAGTSGGTTVNNSGQIQGDIYFNAAGNNNTFNIGNTGTGTGDGSGNANAAVAAMQGTAVTNTPFNWASVSERILSTQSGFAPITQPNIIGFGAGAGNVLHVGGYGYVNSVILSAVGGLDVQVDNNGQLFVANTQQTGSLNARNVDINGTIGLTITQNSSSTTPVVSATNHANLSATSNIGLQFGSFISSGTTAASTAHPGAQTITLISAPVVNDAGLAQQNAVLAQNLPFLFESPGESAAVPTPLSLGSAAGNQTLTITLLPRSTGATNADGTAGLNLSGAALQLFPRTAAALANDPDLGTAIASGLTVYNNNNGASSGINIAASQAMAQSIFSQFAPDVSGGSRQVAIMITDQATGPVGARQRLLRSYANTDGEMTLWGEEFSGMINNKGRFDAEGDLTAYKDHGFGFSLGMDAGSPRGGWFGGALTFYSSDVIETLPRQSKTNLEWYMLSGYTAWRGQHVFLDTKIDLGYGKLDGHRTLGVGNQLRIAEGKRAALLGALGGTTGIFLNYGGFAITPHISLDGMAMREEGFTEAGGGDGFDLDVAPYYANSARTFLGVDAKKSFDLLGASFAPEARLGYRYDFISSPVKLKAGFASTGGLNTPGNSFTFIGPDPDTGNVLLGFGLGAGTDTWHLGIDYDWIRGSNASTTQVGTLTLLGRI
ncbi:MAG TPA: autotransporter domain-containing protein [Rhizomicrobium sp.]|nr:autotransporter domain-containing protein [Rhizomicrobium sp.]